MIGIKIIGFSGRKQSGKDTAAAGLMVRFGFEKIAIVRFADYLKMIFKDCFGVDKFGTEGEKSKNMANYRTVRHNLQYLGTDIMREIDPDCFIRPWKKNIQHIIINNKRNTEFVIVPDVRFSNEVLAIQGMGGLVIRLTRGTAKDQHTSETSLDGSYENFVVRNEEMTILQQWNKVNKIVESYFNLNE